MYSVTTSFVLGTDRGILLSLGTIANKSHVTDPINFINWITLFIEAQISLFSNVIKTY